MVAALRKSRRDNDGRGVRQHAAGPRRAILDESGLDLAQLSGDDPPGDQVILGEQALKGIRPERCR